MTAIEELYHVFSRYRLERPVTGCPHCTSGADDKRLRSKPLRELDNTDLSRYAFKAMTTLGTVEDFKYFLPRIFELVADRNDIDCTDVEVVFGKLDWGKWLDWPAQEREAVKRYFDETWLARLEIYDDAVELDQFLCALASTRIEIEPYLTTWRRTSTLTAALHLAAAVDENYPRVLKTQQAGNAYWDDWPEARNAYTDWLVSSASKAQLEAAFYQLSKDSQLDQASDFLSDAVSRLEWLLISTGRRID